MNSLPPRLTVKPRRDPPDGRSPAGSPDPPDAPRAPQVLHLELDGESAFPSEDEAPWEPESEVKTAPPVGHDDTQPRTLSREARAQVAFQGAEPPRNELRLTASPPSPTQDAAQNHEPDIVGTLTLAELLDTGVSVDWPEAVAIAGRICDAISRHPAAGMQEYMLDTRDVELTEDGDVRVLPGEPGGDPLVKQVGRIFRALLEGTAAPVQLRLVASQAAFDLPGFASVEELAEALRSFESSAESGVIRAAFQRGREAKFSVRANHFHEVHARAAKSPAPEPSSPVWEPAVRKPGPALNYSKMAAAALSVVMIATVAYLSVRELGTSDERKVLPSPSVASNAALLGSRVTPPSRDQGAQAPMVSVPPAVTTLSRPARVARPIPKAPAPVSRPSPEGSSSASSTSKVETPQLLEAMTDRLFFDARILANPMFRLDPAQATPEAVAALRDSKRTLLPAIARRDYENAEDAFRAGDYDRALREGSRVTRILADSDLDVVPVGLREAVEQLIARATAARMREENRVYTSADRNVIPPAALGRQLPAATPAGLSSQAVGTLEMLISQNGVVEAVKLHTPLNRYHERMIVSAAKAWRYKPALKNGKPVRFRLINSINLPES